jgi:hypothetical protein
MTIKKYIATALCALSLASVAPSTPVRAMSSNERMFVGLASAAIIGGVCGSYVANAERKQGYVNFFRWFLLTNMRSILVACTATVLYNGKATYKLDEAVVAMTGLAWVADWVTYLAA